MGTLAYQILISHKDYIDSQGTAEGGSWGLRWNRKALEGLIID